MNTPLTGDVMTSGSFGYSKAFDSCVKMEQGNAHVFSMDGGQFVLPFKKAK
ncbi:MAG: hypothetical protein O9353_08630 [Bacteroidia bacterium]|nr:hypothetical protein [Bacteroidia bacterium]